MIVRIILSLVLLLSNTITAKASFSITYTAPLDPIAEGFSLIDSGGQGNGIINDLGLPAWSISGSSQSYQYSYFSGALTSTQLSDIATTGFTLTSVTRVELGQAPIYNSSGFNTIGGFLLDTGTRRWGITLGIDSNGDTVVVAPTSVNTGGPGNSISTPGPSYTLTGLGNSYETYQLVYNPVSQTADIFVNGKEVIQGYQGFTDFVSNLGVTFSGFSGGVANYNLVNLSSGTSPIPLPATVWFFGSVMAGLSMFGHRRKIV